MSIPEKILVTGGCGFIGHHFIEHLIKNTNLDIVVLDSLTYASNGFDRLRDISVFDDKRIQVLSADFTKPIKEGLAQEIGEIDYIVHMGAETHVDNSIIDPEPFVMANVVGTMHILNLARELKFLKKTVYFSTDEVFGPAPKGVYYKEWDRYNSTNPYSATKAGGEELCLAYANTYKIPVLVTHAMNVYGERQHAEKYIPKVIKACLTGETLYIHSDETKTVPGSRHWIHARNVSDAVLFLLKNSENREKYNIVGEVELNNLDLASTIARIMQMPLNYELVDFHSSRPGHDLRYALDGSKMRDLGWKVPVNFESSLRNTVNWCLRDENMKWLGLEKSEEVAII